MITKILLIALTSAFALLLWGKWGFIEWLQVHGSDLISKMAHCDFCLSWWANVLFSVILAISTNDWSILFVPIVATPITRKLL